MSMNHPSGAPKVTASSVPSADQSTPKLTRALSGAYTLRGAPPTAGMTKTSVPERNAIWLPSGDHLGLRSSSTRATVRLTAPPPPSWAT